MRDNGSTDVFPVIASEAKQSMAPQITDMDCFVAVRSSQ